MSKEKIVYTAVFFFIISLVPILILYLTGKISDAQTLILLTIILIILTVMPMIFQYRTEKIYDWITETFKHKPEEHVETPTVQPNTIEKQNVQVDVRKEQVALAVSAIIFHKTSNPPKILFCYSEKQQRFILPGGHFYKKLGKTKNKVPAWYVDPNARPADFLRKEKLKDKYQIVASLDTDFHAISGPIHMTEIEPTPFLTLAERPLPGEGHEWHYDFYYMCKIEFPEDSKFDDDRNFKWCSLEEVQQLVNDKKTFANLEGVMKKAMDKKEVMDKKKAKKPMTDKRGEEV